MGDIYSGKSAFRYYRVPPQVLMALPDLSIARDRATRTSLHLEPAFAEIFGGSAHRLVFDRASRTCADRLTSHLWTGELPVGAIWEDVPVIGDVTSPLFTLFLLARECSVIELAMAMHEMCGEFAIYQPVSEAAKEAADVESLYGWRRVIDVDGKQTPIWRRPPLVTPDELRDFVTSVTELKWGKSFQAAVDLMQGVTLSPFEVEAAMLLGLPRRYGGYGFAVETNWPIRLSGRGKTLAQRSHCVADIYIENPKNGRAVDIECQGKAIHASLGAAASDADRTTAVEAEGIDVALLSYKQLEDPRRFQLFCEFIAKKLGIRMRTKTLAQQKAEINLRAIVISDWEKLCS